MIKKETGSDVDIKINITDIKVEIKKEDTENKTTETQTEIKMEDNNVINNDFNSFVQKQENQFSSNNSHNAESQDIKPIVQYFEYEDKMEAKIEQHLLTVGNEPDNKITEKGEDIFHIDEIQDMKPIVKYFEYEEMMQLKMEKDLLQEDGELDGNLSQSTSGESGLVVSDVRSLCKEGKLYVIYKQTHMPLYKASWF